MDNREVILGMTKATADTEKRSQRTQTLLYFYG